MADVNDYVTGKILTDTKLALYSLKFVKIPIIRKKLLEKIRKFDPKLVDIKKVPKFIQESEKCAVGERVCRAIHKNSEFTEAVFLDELAEGMVRAGKARYVTKEEAINTLKKYHKSLRQVYGDMPFFSTKMCILEHGEKGLKCLDR